MRVAIEASNIRAGGGITHLVECLAAIDPQEMGLRWVTVYGGSEALYRVPDQPWLQKVLPDALLGGPGARFWWRHSHLDKALAEKADILLVLGGSYLGSFRPFVAFAQNLLPFDQIEQRREGWTFKRLRLLLLERIQGATFQRANGVVYMSAISRDQIQRRLGFVPRSSRVVHHGTSPRFLRRSDSLTVCSEFSDSRPMRLLYVSILEPYKHQRMVVAAVAAARKRGVAVTLDLVGPAAPGEAESLQRDIANQREASNFVRYHGAIAYEQLQDIYAGADAFVFASSCETFGIIVLEAMAAGLPLLCSHRSALPEVAGSAALYFDPLEPSSLVRAVEAIYADSRLRRSFALQGAARAGSFSWQKCARETFAFVREVHDEWQRRQTN